MSATYSKTRVTVNTTEWTAIVAPVSCNYFALRNLEGSELLIRTSKDDPNTEDVLEANEFETVMGPTKFFGEFHRFNAGETILWVKATSGSGPVVATWVT